VDAKKVEVDAKTVRTEWFSGTGAGGSHRNKHQNSCRLIHEPTGTTVTSQQRKRAQSYATAWAELETRLQSSAEDSASQTTDRIRSELIGSGMRADKIRTYRFQDDIVKDHNTGRSAKASHVMRGKFNLLH
jgi:peptide chain release factor 1